MTFKIRIPLLSSLSDSDLHRIVNLSDGAAVLVLEEITLPSELLSLVAQRLRHHQRRAFFKNTETLNEFREIQSLGDAIWLVPVPLGASAFVKGRSIDVPGFHCVSVPGAMFFSGRWVYFAFIINWYAAATTDLETVTQFAAAVHQALTLVKDALSPC